MLAKELRDLLAKVADEGDIFIRDSETWEGFDIKEIKADERGMIFCVRRGDDDDDDDEVMSDEVM